MNRHDRRAGSPPGPQRPPPDPFLYQLARNHEALVAKARSYRAQGTADLAAICALTKDPVALAAFGRATGQTLSPIEYDPEGRGGLVGVGPRGSVARTLREIFGSSFDAARELERKEYRPGVLWTFIYLPSGDYRLLHWSGGLS